MATPFSESEEKKPLLSSISTETATSFRGAGGAITGYHATHSPVSRIERHGDVRGRREALFLHSAEGQGQWFADTNRAKVALTLVTICYFLGYIPSMVIMNPYIYDRIAEEYDYQVNTSSQKPCVKDMNSSVGNTSGIEVQDEIERRVSSLELYLHLTTYLSAIIPILLLGPATDRLGRKIGFFLPIAGTMMKQVEYIIVVGLKLPIPLLYLAHAIEAFGGSFAAMLTAIFSVTSDVTQQGQGRSGWIAVMEALQTLAASLGQVYTAQWMRHGYLPPLICALAFCCLAFLLAVFLLPETKHRDPVQGGGFWETIQKGIFLYIKDGNANEREVGRTNILCKRRLCLLIFVLTVAVNFSRTGVEALFQLKYPLCWAATKLYTFNGLRIFFSWVAILLVLALMQKIFKMVDRHVAIVGIVSSILTNAGLSVAVNDPMVYEASIVGFMTRSIIPMLRSLLSSLVDQAHHGAMFSSLSCIESLGASVFSTAANRIYYATLSSWAGEIFMIFACIMILALIPLLILNLLFTRDRAPADGNACQSGNIQEGSN